MRKPLIISVFNQKGGVGKTTTTVNLAMCFKRDWGRTPLIADFDPQQSAMTYKYHEVEKGYFPCPVETMACPPGTPESVIAARVQDIEERMKHYDVILIDTPAINSELPYFLMNISDLVLLPTKPNIGDMDATDLAWSLVKRSKGINSDLKALVTFTSVKSSKTARMTIVEGSENRMWRDSVANTTIGDRVAYSKAWMYGATIFDSGDSKAVAEIQLLAAEIMNSLEIKE